MVPPPRTRFNVIAALHGHYWEAMAAAARRGVDERCRDDLPGVLDALWLQVQTAFQAALRHERRRAARANDTLLAAGRTLNPHSDALCAWRATWVTSGVCTEQADQLLFP